jgi:voltage-gated potassium channel Kch
VIIIDIVVQRTEAAWADGFVIVADIAYVIFLAVFLRYLMQYLFNEKKVSDESIKGGICIYLLLGVTWGIIYRILHFFDPAAFLSQGQIVPNLFYFSYVTLTTVGYGDIVPATRFAQTLAFMEAVTGQMFIAIFIARLMGLHIAHVVSRKNDPEGS